MEYNHLEQYDVYYPNTPIDYNRAVRVKNETIEADIRNNNEPSILTDLSGGKRSYVQYPPSRVQRPKEYDQRNILCQYEGCTKRYKTASGLKYHIKTVHNNNPNISATATSNCSAAPVYVEKEKKEFRQCCCGQQFDTTIGFQMHIASHTSSRYINPRDVMLHEDSDPFLPMCINEAPVLTPSHLSFDFHYEPIAKTIQL